METKVEDILINIQNKYDRLNSKYSKAYLQGSLWYVGDNLLEWWKNCNNVRYFDVNVRRIELILEVLILEEKNKNLDF